MDRRREPVAGDAPHAPLPAVQGPALTGAAVSAPPPLPDLGGDYVEHHHDKEMGPQETRYTIRQHGARIELDVVATWIGSFLDAGSSTGLIERVYEDRPLVRVRLEDGARRYFDLDRRLLVNAEPFRLWMPGEVPEFGDDEALRRLMRVLNEMAAVFDPGPFLDPRSYAHAGLAAPARETLTASTWCDLVFGPPGGRHFRLGRASRPDGTVYLQSLALHNLLDRQTVWFNALQNQPRGPDALVFGAACLPEHHAAVVRVIRHHAPEARAT